MRFFAHVDIHLKDIRWKSDIRHSALVLITPDPYLSIEPLMKLNYQQCLPERLVAL